MNKSYTTQKNKEIILARCRQELKENGIDYRSHQIIPDPTFNFLNHAMTIVQDENDLKVLCELAVDVSRWLKMHFKHQTYINNNPPTYIRRIFLPKHIQNDNKKRNQYLVKNDFYWDKKENHFWTYWTEHAQIIADEISQNQTRIL